MAYGGWTGKTLRVNLTTGAITTEDTIAKYKDYLGGTGLGYKVLWDEVPPGTKAFDPGNKIIFGVGPLTGSGSPCSGRVSVTMLMPHMTNDLPGTGHMGGHWGPELKYAGWDSIIVEGAAATPVWIKIVNDKVTIEDASSLWGSGIFHATAEIYNLMGEGAHVAAMGQAGENLNPISCVMCDRSHSAGGGSGAVMGSKKLKAIGVLGTGSIKIAADKATWKALNYRMLSMMGANNNGVVPNTQQAWAEYSGGTRWTADKGVYWGAASPPIETGICSAFDAPVPGDCPSPQNKMGLRTHKGHGDYKTNNQGIRHTVKMNGCHACPVRCHIATDIPYLATFGGISRYNQNTCLGNSVLSGLMSNDPNNQDAQINNAMMSNALADDYGIWSDYGLWTADYKYLQTHVMTQAEIDYINANYPVGANPLPATFAGKTSFQNRLPAAELKVLSGNVTGTKPYTPGTPWARADAGDPGVLMWFAEYIAKQQGVLGKAMAMGPPKMATIGVPVVDGGPAIPWPEITYFNEHCKSINGFKMNHIKHHGVENGFQVGMLQNIMWNRDPMNHTHTNYYGNGLPLPVQQAIGKELFTGNNNSIFTAPDDGIGGITNYAVSGRITPAKVSYAARCIVTLEIHNSLTVCNYQLPVWASPNKSMNYRGDDTFDAQVYSAVTGDTLDQKQLETTGLRILTLFRALTARYMAFYNGGTVNMRVDHDKVNPWMFENANSPANAATGNTDCYKATDAPFNGASGMMEVADFDLARDLLYAQFGWDKDTGMPTAATLTKLGLGYIQAEIPSLIVA